MYLARHRLRHGEQKALARLLRTTPRTLRSWRDREGASGSPGRPAHARCARQAAWLQTERAWHALPRGHDGWRSVVAYLERAGVSVPVRLVQECLRELGREARARERERIAERRVHVEVLARDALWALDQTHVMRDEQGELKALVVREGLVAHTLGISVGPPAAGVDVVRLMRQVAQERKTWPFVLQMDNGSENKNAEVAACLREARVIALWNEPGTPEHNGRVERTLGSLKRAAGLGQGRRPQAAGTPLERRTSLCARLIAAWKHLDADTPRAALSGLTPVELDRIAPRVEDRASRARFYTDVSEELQQLARAPLSARARRKHEREAIWRALEEYGLVTRTRGGRLVPTAKAEGIS
jgi:hypothetical protein